ncbi:solute carrier family 23 member 1-like [Notothenia coriiceps]|uniref:Solute carrier family 23 member 1-like n=1 Tax=Notothenia coriiceps TaxID=8208 RepID=A0A6I9PAC6_9TELE|nr:PREDICTED: solute carrier family 23 member 1-like [Notothenia coriiceps]
MRPVGHGLPTPGLEQGPGHRGKPLTVCLILLFSQYLSKVDVPMIAYKDKKWKVFQYPLFKLFSVGSRLVLQTTGLLMIVLGIFGKFGAVFITIPDPVIGGMFLVMFGMIAAVGISNLQYVDLNSSRNLLILGFSTFSGLVLPTWFHSNPGIIDTGDFQTYIH